MAVWTKIETRAAFVEAIADRRLQGEGMDFTLHADGRITGTAGGSRLTGQWVWRDGCFCRQARLGDEDLSMDCEVIEICGNRMRYTRDHGRGARTVVSIS